MLNKIISKLKPKCLTMFLDKLNFFKASQVGKVKQYMFGLMSDFKRFNLETLSLATDKGEQTYRQLRYLIDNASWDEEQLNCERIKFLENDVRTQSKDSGTTVIDDTGVKKYGKHTDGVYYQHYGAEGRNTDCKVAVTTHYADDIKDFPLDIENYYKDENEFTVNESKIDLACLLIEKSINTHKIKSNWFSFDMWYATPKVFKKVESQGKYFVSQLKKNRIVVFQNQRMKVSNFVTVASASSADNGICDCGKCYVQKLGYYRLIVKNKKCFITNNFEVKPEEVIKHYRDRWAIDDFYKQAKDNISFDQFQVRKGLSIIRHWMLVFLTHAFYLHCKLKGVLSKVYNGAIDTLSEFTKIMQNLNIVRIAQQQANVLLANFGFKTLN